MPPAASDRLSALNQQLNHHLETGIIPFWLARGNDHPFGGYLTNYDENGLSLGTPDKYLNTQCRLIWWFSRLYRQFPQYTAAAEHARQGVDFLLKHMWDKKYAGWAWKVYRDGRPLDAGKIVYGQSFAIYALSEYSLATGDSRGVDYAARTFDLLQLHCADTHYGGYYENMEDDWSLAAGGNAAGDRKGLDTHMHLMESFTVLYQATQLPLHRRKLLEVTDLICDKMIDAEWGCGMNQFDFSWQPIPAIAIKRTWNAERVGEFPAVPTETTSYGHNVELNWLLRRALETAGVDSTYYNPYLRRLLDHAVEHGIDWQYGGIFRDGLRQAGPLVMEKEFWQHAEALVGFLDGYQHFADERYLDAFENLWQFISKKMIIEGVGEWRTLLTREGEIIDGNIGNPWKVAYHTGRGVLESCLRLQDLIKKMEK